MTITMIFYENLLWEWSRVLNKNLPSSRIAILIDTSNVAAMRKAVEKTKHCYVAFVRTPFRLGRISATIIIVRVTIGSDDEQTRPAIRDTVADYKNRLFDWELDPRVVGPGKRAVVGSRAAWAAIRSEVLASRLKPYSW
mmetsp:Transcript_31177/g.73178  ORF Transcript_31177/g.73178 Transcript_31177/m.73178 type:complete len:139 (-) Transcript_31177:76-492(-)